MTGRISYLSLYLILLLRFYFFDNSLCYCGDIGIITTGKDSIYVREYLYNGRIWRDLYSHKMNGNQYLFSKEFLPGSVTFNARSFRNLKLRYDILNDELIILTDNGNVLRLNKEMVDSFDIEFEDTAHHFTNSSEDSIIGLNGYAEVLYNGITTLYIKHKKEIFRLSQGSTNDVFEESNRVYVFKNGKINKVNNPKDFIALLEDKKQEITSFIKTKKLKISRKTPESLVPILKYYDSLVY